jgi:heme-degrading monooxygenase HmoA
MMLLSTKACTCVLFCFYLEIYNDDTRISRINEEVKMIARIWHGRVPTSKAEAYRKFTIGRAIPDYQSVKGNAAVYLLERAEGEITHFITLTFWDSLESVKGFAGEDVEKAKYYPEDNDYLLEFEPNVVHYEIVGQS